MGVIDIRGTHGSGKSWIVHQILKTYPHTPVLRGPRIIGYVLPSLHTAVVGRYQTECGGCDGASGPEEVCRRVGMFSRMYHHILMEGILVSHTFKRYSRLATNMKDYGYTFCFLNTPLIKCIARVKGRRIAKGNRKPLDPTNLRNDYANIWRGVQSKCVAAGHRVVVLNYLDPLPQVLKLLNENPEF